MLILETPEKKKFFLDKEDMKVVLVWIRLYSFPSEYWDPKILEDLGNPLGKLVKISEQTKAQRYMAYARRCVYMDLTKELPESIKIPWEAED